MATRDEADQELATWRAAAREYVEAIEYGYGCYPRPAVALDLCRYLDAAVARVVAAEGEAAMLRMAYGGPELVDRGRRYELHPVVFPEANARLGAPEGMPDCGELPVYRDGQQCISAWYGTAAARLQFLVTGRIWLRVVCGPTQPPVALEISRDGPFVVGGEVADG